ncbi:hypothetical protein [Burkholderia gladioli]|uniref:hypothetical protein n=1 Tax=Burkholderia gladioli TaxID=28095 RepID=UPI00163E182A|nr:hypothetical protein [Burkholderia gladioli]
MSVKIHCGFKLVQRELAGIVTAMDDAKPRIEKLQRQQYLRVYASVLVEAMDRARLELAAGGADPLISGRPDRLVRDSISKRQARVRASRERDPDVDLDVTLTCWLSPYLGEVIGIPFGELDSQVQHMLKDTGVVTDYAYWDGVDPDDDVPRQEWSRRKVAWGEVMARKVGMGFQFRFEGEQPGVPIEWGDVAPHIPNLDRRSRELADPRLFSRWYRALPDVAEDSADIWQRHGEFRRLLQRDPVLRQQQAEEVARIKPLLLSVEELSEARFREQMLLAPSGDRE